MTPRALIAAALAISVGGFVTSCANDSTEESEIAIGAGTAGTAGNADESEQADGGDAEEIPDTGACGDAKCDADENAELCPEDCGDTGPTCGDGTCDPSETIENCNMDCEAPQPEPNPTQTSCLGQCGEFLGENAECQCDKQCDKYDDCCSDYDKYCIQSGHKCGNDTCDEGEEELCPEDCQPDPKSCEDKCGQEDDEADCQCHDGCVKAENCCEDYEALCLEEDPPEPESTPMECVNQKCQSQLNKCTNSLECTLVLSCVNECDTDVECATACGKELANPDKKLLDNLLKCAQNKKCLPAGD